MKKIAMLLLAAVPAFAQAQPAALTRFTYALDNLQQTYAGQTVNATLANSGFNNAQGVDESPRELLFRLESLFRLYGTAYPQLSSQFLAPVKALEDAIGHYGDTQDFLQEAQEGPQAGNAAYIQQMTQNNTDALNNIETILNSWATPTNSPEVDAIRAAVTPIFSTITDAQDRTALVNTMLAQVNTLETKNFDMTKLEDGIHELRRQARWVEYYTYAIGGLFVWDTAGTNAQCPADSIAAGYNNQGLDSYGAATPIAPVATPCYLAACLGAEISNIQNTLAGIKETAVLGNAQGDQNLNYASPEVTAQATALYNQLLGKNGAGPNILDELKTQLQACLPVAVPAPAQQ